METMTCKICSHELTEPEDCPSCQTCGACIWKHGHQHGRDTERRTVGVDYFPEERPEPDKRA